MLCRAQGRLLTLGHCCTPAALHSRDRGWRDDRGNSSSRGSDRRDDRSGGSSRDSRDDRGSGGRGSERRDDRGSGGSSSRDRPCSSWEMTPARRGGDDEWEMTPARPGEGGGGPPSSRRGGGSVRDTPLAGGRSSWDSVAKAPEVARAGEGGFWPAGWVERAGVEGAGDLCESCTCQHTCQAGARLLLAVAPTAQQSVPAAHPGGLPALCGSPTPCCVAPRSAGTGTAAAAGAAPRPRSGVRFDVEASPALTPTWQSSSWSRDAAAKKRAAGGGRDVERSPDLRRDDGSPAVRAGGAGRCKGRWMLFMSNIQLLCLSACQLGGGTCSLAHRLPASCRPWRCCQTLLNCPPSTFSPLGRGMSTWSWSIGRTSSRWTATGTTRYGTAIPINFGLLWAQRVV